MSPLAWVIVITLCFAVLIAVIVALAVPALEWNDRRAARLDRAGKHTHRYVHGRAVR